MEAGFSQDLTTKQSQVITLELQRSLKILQLPLQELELEINRELVENPLLEIDESKSSSQSEEAYYSNTTYSMASKEGLDPLMFAAKKETLKDFLLTQLGELELDMGWRILCRYLIENIDSRGYLGCSIQEIAEDMNIENEVAEKGLKIIQDLQPDGVGARDLKECLNLQLKKKNIVDKALFVIIEKHLDLVAQMNLKQIVRTMNIDFKGAQKLCGILKTLEPYPSRGYYTGDDEHYVTPEAFISREDGELVIIMNDHRIPSLKINLFYKEMLHQVYSKDVKDYIKEKLMKATELIKGIERRQSTLYRILDEIINLQKEYFVTDNGTLNPMMLKDIALLLDLHESTISRAINGKYISTPKETILIKDFFTTRLETYDEEVCVSSNDIKKKIRDLIQVEDVKKPLSDQEICNQLSSLGLKISRRTVTKYREELCIATSSKRSMLALIKTAK